MGDGLRNDDPKTLDAAFGLYGVVEIETRDTPFERYIAAARSGVNSVWLTLLGISVVFAFVVFAGGFAVGVMGPDSVDYLFFSLGLIGSGWIALAVVYQALHRISPMALLGPSPSDFFRGAVAGAAAVAIVFVLLGAQFLSSSFAPSLTPREVPQDWIWLALTAAGLIALQASAEEGAFRGYLQQQLGARFQSPLIWAVAPSLLFGALHYAPEDPNNPEDVQLAYAFFISATLFGLFAAYATWRTGSLGFAIGLHIANNLIAILLVDQMGDVLGVLALFEIATPKALELVVSEIVYLALLLAVLETPWSPIHRLLRLPAWR